jgi:hypothetical protein
MKTQTLTEEIIAAYKHAINEERKIGKWTPAKSAAAVTATVSALKTADGNPITLTDDQKAVIEGVVNPTTKSKLATIDFVLAQHDVELDGEVKALLSKLFNSATVQKQIEAIGKPTKMSLKDLINA